MKSQITHKTSPEYPKLMQSKSGSNIVVLFSEPGVGIVVNGKDSLNPIGSFSHGWAMDYFEDFDGSITLSNS